jgi:hypothetical protein
MRHCKDKNDRDVFHRSPVMAAITNLNSWLNPLADWGYQFWSGIGSGSPIIAGFWIWWHHHTCGAPRCYWFGRYPTADGVHHLCRHHHPDLLGKKRTLAEIHAAHRAARF